MATKKTRIKTAAVEHPVPQSREEVIEAIAEIGTAQRERDRIQADMNDQLSKLREQFEAEAKPHAERIVELTQGVHLYCEAHREELTNAGKVKTHAFASGEVKWRKNPPSVAIRAAEVVIETLKRLGLGQFVREKEEINKEAILADIEAVKNIKGITIAQKEDFIVQPWDTKLEEVA
jgi:phage host-nuclease inhibitor protein Gam